MGVIFKIGNDGHLPPVPETFPTCGSWFSSTKSIVNSTISKDLVSSNADIKHPSIGENELGLVASQFAASPLVDLNEDHDLKDEVP